MTVIIIYPASANARNRRRAKRAAERELKQSRGSGSDRVWKAIYTPVAISDYQPSEDNRCLPLAAGYAAGFRQSVKKITAR